LEKIKPGFLFSGNKKFGKNSFQWKQIIRIFTVCEKNNGTTANINTQFGQPLSLSLYKRLQNG
jgi:hypothetical protein